MELQPVKKVSDTNTTLRRPPLGMLFEGENMPCKILSGLWHERRHLDCREESRLSMNEQMTMGRLISGHHLDLKYCLHKIGRAIDAICRKCGVEEETAEHVVYDWPRIHHPSHEPTTPDALAKDPQKELRILEKWNSVPDVFLFGVHPLRMKTTYSSTSKVSFAVSVEANA